MGEKSTFYSRDPGSGVAEGVQKEKPYSGVERRRDTRRKNKDRRGDVRFEVDKDDRRKTEGRRKGDKTPKFW